MIEFDERDGTLILVCEGCERKTQATIPKCPTCSQRITFTTFRCLVCGTIEKKKDHAQKSDGETKTVERDVLPGSSRQEDLSPILPGQNKSKAQPLEGAGSAAPRPDATYSELRREFEDSFGPKAADVILALHVLAEARLETAVQLSRLVEIQREEIKRFRKGGGK